MSRTWTPSQQDAIEARRGTLLVSAAAGSGKTAVLVQRVMERLTDPKNPTDADRLLVVTFTKAAAAEMSGRVSAQISSMLERDPSNYRLQRQQILMTRAHISTIHSFCGDLIRDNFQKLGVSPDFRILDENEMALLRSEALEQALEEEYEQGNPLFYQLVEAFSVGKDDSRLAKTVGTLYDFVRSHPFPGRWLREKAAAYRAQLPAARTPWGEVLLDYAVEALAYGISITENSLSLMDQDEVVSKAYQPAYESDCAGLKALREKAELRDWDGVCRALSCFVWQKCKPLRGFSENPLKNKLSANRKEVKTVVEKLTGLFCATQEECAEDLKRCVPLVDALFSLTEKFEAILEEKKAARRAADFGDLEHWALRLLVRDTGNGFERTPEAQELSMQFDEVMVDEYQDTNEAQDMIFRAVSREESNLFFVGDVKQSIYGFRQAMPQIFLRRRQSYPLYRREADTYPACVLLDRNFRSICGVTDAVNFVFRQLMSRGAGDLDYTKEEELVPAADYPKAGEPSVQLDILNLSGPDAEETAVEAESRRLAKRIREIVEHQTVWENGVSRRAKYSDVCILLRSANRYASEYARLLQAAGIPAWADTAGGFFAAVEIAVAVAFLRVIDNPLQDIPLLSVLMSPIYGFTPDDMAEIRIGDRKESLYLALVHAAQEGSEQANAFLADLEEYRALAATMPSDRLILSLFQKTGYPNLVQAMPNGGLRLANLHLLLEYARRYEASGYNGLAGFIRLIDRLERQDADLSAASSVSEASNVVKIMSIHRSKGLEFPICILAGCSRRFHKEHGDALLHPELGLGIKLRDEQTGSRYTTLPREAVSLALDQSEMSEELRVLYVAMTRAKEQLILMTSIRSPEKTLGRLASRLTGEPRIQPYLVRSASSISDWLLLCALRHPSGGALRALAGADSSLVVPSQEPWKICLVESAEPEQVQKSEAATAGRPLPGLLKQLETAVDYVYPYTALSGIRAKIAASDFASKGFAEEYAAASRPAFLERKGMTPVERGTALHAFLEFADFQAARANPKAELARLIEHRFLTEEQGRAVDLSRIQAFFSSSIAKRILASKKVLREYRFSVELPAQQCDPNLPVSMHHETIVLQGAVDCAFEEDGALVLVDFKTDRTANAQELWRRYSVQLALYQEALTRCTGLPVRECLLYSFHLNREIYEEE